MAKRSDTVSEQDYMDGPASKQDLDAGADRSEEEEPESASSAPTPSPSSSSPSPTSPVSSHPIKVEEDFFGAEELVKELGDPGQFGKRGEAWFFAQVATVLLVIFPPVPLYGLIDLVGTLSLTTGLVFLAYSLFSLGRNISPMPQPRKKHSLVVSGMYSYCRHPMYSGLLLTSLGLAAVTHSEIRLALCGLLWYILEKKIATEEQFLTAIYQEYEEYTTKVKKLIPFLY